MYKMSMAEKKLFKNWTSGLSHSFLISALECSHEDKWSFDYYSEAALM